MTRQSKTPKQRAQEQLDVARRHADRLAKKAKALRADLENVEREHRAATARADYLKQHPDLGHQGPSTTPPNSTGATS